MDTFIKFQQMSGATSELRSLWIYSGRPRDRMVATDAGDAMRISKLLNSVGIRSRITVAAEEDELEIRPLTLHMRRFRTEICDVVLTSLSSQME